MCESMQIVRYLLGTAIYCTLPAYVSVDYGTINPSRYYLGTNVSNSDFGSWRNETITLTPSAPLLVLDFATEVAGFLFFHVSSVLGTAQIEIKYGEEFQSLSNPNSDGPWTFSNGLSNTFRVETLNLTDPGRFESFFIQGGQRWESCRGQSSWPLKDKKRRFKQSFYLGGRVVQASCVDAGNAPSTWQITEHGALVRGQASAQSALGAGKANYTLHFDIKIVRGGTGWRVASAVQPIGPYFVLTSEYPESSTFVNTNRTLLPPNTLVFNNGWSLVYQSTLETPTNLYFPLDVMIQEDKWYRISTAIHETGYRIQIDRTPIVDVPLPSPIIRGNFGTSSPYEGTWGFGAYQDHVTYFRNYRVAPLDYSVCLDGAKRDRLVWIGDFYHTVRVNALSTSRSDYITGTIDYVFSYQEEEGLYEGFVPIPANFGARPRYKYAYPD
ncbi:hypothetical protein BS50DRAFT_651939 [Corynespora cassiicola Philippines]|uniref:Uncharacterized protein n=1 Tax=Corynespora cassiicola Philippines TaxID=1448308 RepID=A0A2T2N6R8_CORCC|nr:hypothetical protein BS50DRAFT_651939 [Corynespora cassiicola Philippines]